MVVFDYNPKFQFCGQKVTRNRPNAQKYRLDLDFSSPLDHLTLKKFKFQIHPNIEMSVCETCAGPGKTASVPLLVGGAMVLP